MSGDNGSFRLEKSPSANTAQVYGVQRGKPASSICMQSPRYDTGETAGYAELKDAKVKPPSKL
jgi:hypothetical protein